MKTQILTPIVKRALVETVTDIGQLTPAQLRELNDAVDAGYLAKGKGGPYPKSKIVYAHPGFDFAAEREFYRRQFLVWQALDLAHGTVTDAPPGEPDSSELFAAESQVA